MKTRLDTLLAYGFRPFFLLAAAHAVFTTLAWALMLAGRVPAISDFPIGWHAFEMIFGFVGAGLAGFLLTAVPSFTNSRPVTGRALLALVALWLAGRASMWLIAWTGPLPAAVLNLAFLGLLIAYVAPALWSDRHRRHRVFGYLLLALWSVQALVWLAWSGWLALSATRVLDLSVAVLALLIIAAASRVSMQIVNEALDARYGQRDDDCDDDCHDNRHDNRRYLARPPRRNLAMTLIVVFALVEFWLGPGSTAGWLGLAAAAGMLNLLNDWHLGRVLTDTYVAVLYLIYWLLALGLALLGIGDLFGHIGAAPARHLITTGAVGLAMMAVLVIAGQRHTGRAQLERGPLIHAMFALILAAAGLRSLVPLLWPAATLPLAYIGASVLWAGAFALYLLRFTPWLTAKRIDGRPG